MLLFYLNYTPTEELWRAAAVSLTARSPRYCSGADEPQGFLQKSLDKIDHSLKQSFLQMMFSQMDNLLQCFTARTGLLLQRATTVPAEPSPRNSQLMHPEILLSTSGYFRLLCPNCVLFKESWVCNFISGTKENVVFMFTALSVLAFIWQKLYTLLFVC